MTKKVLLIILDGWGIATDKKVSAIDQAKTPFINSLYSHYPNSKLNASGLSVGLPEGQMGNSEVGHINIGAGRVVYQELTRINKTIQEKELNKNRVLLQAFEYARVHHKNIHLIGLLSDGGVHSHINHLKTLLSIAHEHGMQNIFIHPFTDGRDTDPKSGVGYIEDIQEHINKTTGKLASIVGRYYSMDRDNRWERISLAYHTLVNGLGEKSTDAVWSVKQSYRQGITDEFIKPIVIVNEQQQPIATLQEGDVVICFNFRTDRARQLTQALTQQDFLEQGMKKLNLHYITFTNYDETFTNVNVVFEKDNLQNTLGEVLAKSEKKQIRIAETEKYPHVTFFFSGGQENPFEGESRILCPSPKVATYDLKPEMSAHDIKNAIIPELQKRIADFICLNFANPDMVGHTGVFDAVIKACETVDTCTEAVVKVAQENNYSVIIIADHGNADFMINPDGTPNTAHTTNLVPCILIDSNFKGSLRNGKLADVAPTILTLMGIDIPTEMTGDVLCARS